MKPARPKYRTEFIYTTYPGPHEVAWYKWEFLRRNPEYRADYEKFIHSFGTWFKRKGFWYDEEQRMDTWTKSDEEYFYAKIAPMIARICEKWRIGNLFPPEWRFNKKTGLRKVAGDREMFPPTAIAPELNWDFPFMRYLLDMGFTGTADSARRLGNLLLMEFDLNWPMKDLVRYAKYVLVRAMENYRDERKELCLKVPRSRRRFEDYDTHLRIWNLKQRNRSVAEIAGLVFPNESADTALQKVRDHLKAAEKLILGGYKEIR